MEAFSYYDWTKTLSYDAEVTMVITARGRGKTYGIRKQATRDAIKNGVTFVEVCRYKSELPGVISGYFDRLSSNGEFGDAELKTDGPAAYYKDGDEWRLIGYFVALSDQQQLKKHTFNRVRRIIFDEVILDVNDRYHRYLPHEFDAFANLIDTITRQRPGEETMARVYLLGNSVDLVNPYFQGLGIRQMPKYGYTWYNNKHFLLHYEDAKEWGDARRDMTLVGHLLSDSEANRSLYNSFDVSNEFIEDKTRYAIFQLGITYNGTPFGVWYDQRVGIVYINDSIPKGHSMRFALTLEDQHVDLSVLSRTSQAMKSIAEAARVGLVRYSSPVIQEKFKEILAIYGLR